MGEDAVTGGFWRQQQAAGWQMQGPAQEVLVQYAFYCPPDTQTSQTQASSNALKLMPGFVTSD